MELADLATPMAVRVAATLRLADHASGAGATADRLAADTGSDATALRTLLDHLVTAGVFDHEPESGRYRPTELGRQLRRDSPDAFSPLDIHSAAGRGDLAFVELLHTVTTGTSAYAARYGRGFWDDLDAHPPLRRSFDAQMNWRFRTQASQIAERVDWGRFRDVLDVGGGDGALLREILRVHPTVRGRIIDLAPTADAAARRLADAGFGDRAGALTGSFFDPLPTGADAYLLSDIVHDWNDENALRILTRCREAAAPSGARVLLVETAGVVGTAMDLFMLMCFSGRERDVDELVGLAARAGLRRHAVTPVADDRTLLEFVVADEHRGGLHTP